MLRTRARPWLVVATAVALVTTGAATTAVAEDQLVLDHGHIDAFALTWTDNKLDLQLQEDVTGSHVLHAPEDVLLKVKPEAAFELPDPVPPALSFLGEPGDVIHHLPQTQDPNLIWPGWSTERIPGGVFTNPLRIDITEVTGPGNVFLWQTGAVGNPISVLNGGGYQLPGTISPNVGVHAHAEWAFSEQGTYSFTVVASGTLAGGGTATSVERAYTFQVGDVGEEPPTTSLSVTGLADHYHSGDVVTLTAVQDPVTDLDHYHWFTRAAGTTEWQIVPDAGGAQYSFTASAQHDGLAVIARLYDHDHNVVAESEPVTVVVDDHGEEPPPAASQEIEATLAENAGALVISVDPDDWRVVMSDLELGTSGDRWVSSGDLRPVMVTDTRSAAPGWTVSAQVGDFTAGAETLRGGSLGWTPVVNQQAEGAGVVAGPSVPSGFSGGDGLSAVSVLASAEPGTGFGSSELGAGLVIEAPTTLRPGTYTATITFTVI